MHRLNRSNRFAMAALCLGGLLAGPAVRAASISYYEEVNNAGAGITAGYGTLGYDLYSTAPDGQPVDTGPTAFGPGRVNSLPTFISTVNAAGANSYFRSGTPGQTYSYILNPQTNSLVHTGLTYNFSSSNGEKGLLAITLGSNVPSNFYVGYLTDVNSNYPGDYPDALRFAQSTGASPGDSGLINTVQDSTGGIDAYYFKISSAAPGDVITISGVETVGGPGYYNLTCAGLVFATNVPEPASLAAGAILSAALLRRTPRNHRVK